MSKQYVLPQQGSAADLLFDSSFSPKTAEDRLDLAKDTRTPTGAAPSNAAPMPSMPMVPTTIGPFNSTLEQQYPDGVVGLTTRARLSQGEFQGGEVALDYRRDRLAYKLALQHTPASSYGPDSTQLEFRVEYALGHSAAEKSERKEKREAVSRKFDETSGNLRTLADSLATIPTIAQPQAKASALLTGYTKLRSLTAELLDAIQRNEGSVSEGRRKEVKSLLLHSGVDQLIAAHASTLQSGGDIYATLLLEAGGYDTMNTRLNNESSRQRISGLIAGLTSTQ